MKTLAAILVVGASISQAQTTPADNATLQALLTEVRQLRLALERSASVTPMIQLTLQRIQVQQTEVSRASAQLDALRLQMGRSAEESVHLTAHLKAREAFLAQEQDAAKRKVIEDEIKMIKAGFEQQAEQRGIQETQQRAREGELAGRLYAEQAKMTELTEKLNSLERLLPVPSHPKP
jgi:hypothetical protein